MGDDLFGKSGFRGSTWPGRNNDSLRLKIFDLTDRSLVVPMHHDLKRGINFPQPLYEVVGKRVVIIEDENHGVQWANSKCEECFGICRFRDRQIVVLVCK